MQKTSSYRDALLRNSEGRRRAQEYLTAALEDSPAGFSESVKKKTVAQAHK